MTRIAMGDVWDEARAFISREAALIVPLAFATLGLSYLLLGFAAPARLDANAVAGPWLFVFVPCLLLTLFGNLAISALVLVPRATVGEACRGALARVARAVLAMLLALLALVAVSFALALVAGVLQLLGAGAVAQQIVTAGLLAFAFWVTIRLLPLLPVIAVSNPRGSPIAALRLTLALTRQRTAPIAGVFLLYLAAFLLISIALGLALGSVLTLLARMIGDPGLGETLVAVMSAAVTSLLQAAWAVFVAMLARRLLRAHEA